MSICGHARNFLEAILWHGGKGKKSWETVRRMLTSEREALLEFLGGAVSSSSIFAVTKTQLRMQSHRHVSFRASGACQS
ncbi:MAG: hypothetical protein LBT71_07310 [Azoarcus sp.]|nr:hypothetical protein [Azoarcus sp.]